MVGQKFGDKFLDADSAVELSFYFVRRDDGDLITVSSNNHRNGSIFLYRDKMSAHTFWVVTEQRGGKYYVEQGRHVEGFELK